MKKLCLCFILLFTLCFLSCGKQSYGILSYQEKNIEAECTLNGEYKILIKKDGAKRSVSFLEPSSLCSVCFVYENDKIIGRAGEMEIPLNKESLDGVMAILGVFSLSEECLTYASGSGEGDVLEFVNELGSYRLTIGKNDLPKRIVIESSHYDYDILVDAISIK